MEPYRRKQSEISFLAIKVQPRSHVHSCYRLEHIYPINLVLNAGEVLKHFLYDPIQLFI